MKKILNALFVALLAVFTFSSCSDVPAPYEILEPGSGNQDGVQPTGEGTKENPYNVVAAQQNQNGSVAWVEGYIVGTIENVYDEKGEFAGNKANFSGPFEIKTNVMIAASADETNEKNCLPVKIKNGSDLSNALNLQDHPENLKGKLLIQGKLAKGFGKAALVETTAAVFNDKEVGEEQGGDTPSGDEVNVTDKSPYSVSFASDLAGFKVENKVSEGLTGDVWYYSKKYTSACASSYNGSTNVAVEGWMYSPVLNLSTLTKATLTFEHSSYRAGDPNELMLKVKESTSSEWANLTIPNYSDKRDNKVVTTIDLSTYAGKKVQLAFVYNNPEGGSNNTWYIHSLKVAAGEGGEVTPPTGDDPFGLDASNPKSTLTADFNEVSQNNQNYSLEGWVNKAVQGANVWQAGIYNEDKYIKASPYKVDSGETMETWFITPAFTVDAKNKFTFDCAGANWQSDMTLKVFFIQKEASGSLTKEEITVNGIPTSGTNFTWVKDLIVDLSAYNGKVGFIGFQYVVVSTGATKGLPTYQIDNVKYGQGGGTVEPEPEPQPSGENLLVNPGFEDWTENTLVNWGKIATISNALFSVSSDAYEGAKSVLLKGDSKNKRFASDMLTLEKGTYELKVYAKNSVGKGKIRLGYILPNSDGTPVSDNGYVYLIDVAEVADTWTAYTATINLESESPVSIFVVNSKSGSNNNFVIDQISLIKH